MNNSQEIKMTYRQLGKTGLKVSCIGLGFGTINNQELITSLVKAAYANGINFFDNAEMYFDGEIEKLFGNAIKELKIPREDLVFTTKIFWGGKGVNSVGLSRKHIVEGLNKSLKRLQLDYVDVIYAHKFDKDTPLEEICRAFNFLINQGKALYWGTSDWSAKKLSEAIELCKELNLMGPIVEQPEYNLITREKIEKEYVDLFELHGLGTTVYSPLCGGILTERYLNDIPEDSRYVTFFLKSFYDRFLDQNNIENTRAKIKAVKEIANEVGGTVAQLSLAWVIKNPDVNVALIGATKLSQFEDSIKAINLVDKITKDHEKKLDEIFKTKPSSDLNYRTFPATFEQGRREKVLKF